MPELPLIVRSAAQNAQILLEKEYTRQWTVSTLAEHLGVSPVHLAEAFQELTGTDVPGYVRRVRIARAAQLLTSPGVRIAEVAFAVGYNSSCPFVDAFQKELGLLPSQYRARAVASGQVAA